MFSIPATEESSLQVPQPQPIVYDPLCQGPAWYFVVSSQTLPVGLPLHNLKPEPADPLQHTPKLTNSYFDQTEEIKTNPIKLEIPDPLLHDMPQLPFQTSMRTEKSNNPLPCNMPMPSFLPFAENHTVTSEVPLVNPVQVMPNFYMQGAPIIPYLLMPIPTVPDKYNPLLEGPASFSEPSAVNSQMSPKPRQSVKMEMRNPLEATSNFSVGLHPVLNTQPVPIAILRVSRDDKASTSNSSVIQDEASLQVNESAQEKAHYWADISKSSIQDINTNKYGTNSVQFEHSNNLQSLVSSNTAKPPFICDLCKKVFKTRYHLTRHKVSHIDYRQFECRTCGKLFKTRGSLKLHWLTHRPKVVTHCPFVCGVCQKVLKGKRGLATHMLIHTTSRLFDCKICGKSFLRAASLKRHSFLHTPEWPFMCDVCQKGFKHKHLLTNHMHSHTNSRPFECKTCGKSFKTVACLKHHIHFVHTAKPTFICDLCKRGYTRKSCLATHMRTHADSMPYECETCGKSFKTAAYLKHHFVFVHTAKPTFICDLCQKGFKRKTNLAIHMRIHAGPMPYECKACEISFKRKSGLKFHFLTHAK